MGVKPPLSVSGPRERRRADGVARHRGEGAPAGIAQHVAAGRDEGERGLRLTIRARRAPCARRCCPRSPSCGCWWSPPRRAGPGHERLRRAVVEAVIVRDRDVVERQEALLASTPPPARSVVMLSETVTLRRGERPVRGDAAAERVGLVAEHRAVPDRQGRAARGEDRLAAGAGHRIGRPDEAAGGRPHPSSARPRRGRSARCRWRRSRPARPAAPRPEGSSRS